MKTIWKFPLKEVGEQMVDMPVGAEILSVQLQRGRLCLWAKVDTENPREFRRILIFGTGHPMEYSCKIRFIDTFQVLNDDLVFHVFENLPVEK